MSNKYHIAASGKNAGKYVPCLAAKNCRNGGKHINSDEYNNLSKIETANDIFTTIDNQNQSIEPQWSINEKYIAERIAEQLPENYSLQRMGAADSTVSDIAIYNEEGNLVTFVEAKSEKSQCGQFVLIEDGNGKLTATSGLDNPHTVPLTNILNEYKEKYPTDTRIDPSKLSEQSKTQVYDWIRDHYRGMGASFIGVTDNSNSYVKLIPLDDLENEVDVTLNFPRIKQSGSANLPKSHKEAFHSAMKISKISEYSHKIFEQDGKTFVEINNRSLSVDEQYVDKENYFLSKIEENKSSTIYIAKKRSNTKNINEVLGFEYKGSKADSGFDLLINSI